ncbi:MAG: preprotein translocase subunit SecG [Prevotellaceae bacterium]|jgi:preprotein translocase subunit SecG|nr:preprotein translocase subunit SecG [Prevotellaceae bacterium]
MYSILIVLAIIVSILLVFIVLVQNSKGGGLAANFAAGNQIFGVRQTADTLEKATWYLSITLGLLCIFATLTPPKGASAVNTTTESIIQRNINPMQNPAAQPGFATEPAQSEEQQNTQQTQPQQEEQVQQQETETE